MFRGTGGIAGELGHVVTDEKGPLCRCGSRGCLEAQISVNALAASLSATHGAVTPAGMLELAAEGDLGARRIVADAATLAGKAVGALCNYFNPDTVIVSGELVRAGPVVLDSIRDAMTRVSLPRAIENVDLRLGELGELAELYGAAFYAKQRSIRQAAAHARAAVGRLPHRADDVGNPRFARRRRGHRPLVVGRLRLRLPAARYLRAPRSVPVA